MIVFMRFYHNYVVILTTPIVIDTAPTRARVIKESSKVNRTCNHNVTHWNIHAFWGSTSAAVH